MSDDKRFDPSSFKDLFNKRRRHKRSIQNVSNGSDGAIQDQIIIAPEVMKKILENLNLGSLKKVRLVCKSWLREAQTHMERRGIVLLHETPGSSSSRVQKFIKMREKKLPALPQPFCSIDVSLGQHGSIILEGLVTQIRNLDSDIKITRFTQGVVPLELLIQLVHQHASTLEYLILSLKSTNEAVPKLSEGEQFPNLRHLVLGIENMNFNAGQISGLVALIAGMVKASPRLETCEFPSVPNNASELASSLMMAVDISNVKTLKFSQIGLSSEALLHFMSIQFCQLEDLRIIFPRPNAAPLNVLVLTSILPKCAATLKTLNLSSVSAPENLADFPILPCVKELTLDSFPYSNNFLPERFPSLEVLNVASVDVDVLGDSWTALPPLPGLKTLRTKGRVLLRGGDDPDERPIRFLSKFPNLGRVRLNYSFVMHCCRMKATGNRRVRNLLGSLKHLELGIRDLSPLESMADEDYCSPFAALTGIESLTLVEPDYNLVLFPFQEMFSLKVLRIPWHMHPLFDENRRLSPLARGLEKMVITNCCSLPSTGSLHSTERLHSFLATSPNAECGCKDWKETSPEWS